MEAITRPWEFTPAGRLVTAVGRRVSDGKCVYVDSTGSWCRADGMYQVPGEARPLRHSALIDKQLEVPASLYNFLSSTTDQALHVKLANGTLLVPMEALAPAQGPAVYLNPKGKVVNECGSTSETWKKHNRGPQPPKLKSLPDSVRASRSSALGCVPRRQATVVCSPTVVTIRVLQNICGRKRARSGLLGATGCSL